MAEKSLALLKGCRVRKCLKRILAMDEPQFDADLEKHNAEISLLDNVSHAHIKGGKSFGGQIREILKLGRNPIKIIAAGVLLFSALR